MTLEPLLIAELIALGLFTGFLAGLLGIGGGMLMVPFLTFMLSHRNVGADLAVKMAIATSMATIVFTSLSSVRAHHRRGAVRWDLVRGLAPGIVIGAAFAGLGAFAVLKGATL
ncbi:MAG: TSUP family transporter, partial [Burkholderiaceae bacterium]